MGSRLTREIACRRWRDMPDPMHRSEVCFATAPPRLTVTRKRNKLSSQRGEFAASRERQSLKHDSDMWPSQGSYCVSGSGIQDRARSEQAHAIGFDLRAFSYAYASQPLARPPTLRRDVVLPVVQTSSKKGVGASEFVFPAKPRVALREGSVPNRYLWRGQ